jgi:redox-sensitive bicupin YhaK (pirin superfamily)
LKPTIEGAAVGLHRAFGFGPTKDYDPFLLPDDFWSENPDDYLAGFPWHPHRGMATITYLLAGSVEHGDSLGNQAKWVPGTCSGWLPATASCTGRCPRATMRPDARLPALGKPAGLAEK